MSRRRQSSSARVRVQRLGFAALASAALAACAAGAYPLHSSSGSAALKLQQRGAVGGIAVTPLRIEEDSRCPAGVQCIQAGTVRLLVRIEDRRSRRLAVVTLEQPIRLAPDSWLTLCDIVPGPARPGRIRPAAYRFGFDLRRGSPLPPTAPACARPVPAPRG